MKIFLIGMPGSGKTTLGKELAAHLGIEFVDLDAEIENVEGKSISEIFKQKGEMEFRLLEARLLREWAGGNRDFVMATGGGAPCFFHGMDTINKSGLSIFLDVPVPELIERVRKNTERPLLVSQDEQQLREKLVAMREKRQDCYRQAQVTLENPSLEEALKKIAL
ncbi:MAG TPA: shikimate kinase [Chryseosolibacter sp.]